MGLLLQLNHGDHVCRGGTFAIEAAEEAHSLFYCELFGELGFLQGNAEQLAEGPVILAPAAAQDQHLAAIRGVEPLAAPDPGGFAGAIGPEKAKALAGLDLQV